MVDRSGSHRVIHVLRAPVGGLFRHVRDLVAVQHGLGLAVGVVCDSNAADSLTEARLAALGPHLDLGLHRTPMSRDLGFADVTAWSAIHRLADAQRATVLHGHGAKGGAYARLATAWRRRGSSPLPSAPLSTAMPGSPRCFYTPHGGSLHYHPQSLKGRIYMALERRLERVTSGLIFESAYSERIYRAQVGVPSCASRVIPNGLLPTEFGRYRPAADACDLLFVGELRRLKGVDVLIEAIAAASPHRNVTALIVGEGPDAAEFKALATARRLDGVVRFAGAMPAAQAFPRGRVLVMPSRAESFPYIVLEAAAAGIPLIASAVGGIPEIVAGTDTTRVPPDDVAALTGRILADLADPATTEARAERLQASVAARFTVAAMARSVTEFYDLAGDRDVRLPFSRAA